MSDIIDKYWKNFCEEKQMSDEERYDVGSFGNTKQMADELAELVNKGIKTATTSAYELYGQDDHLPEVGDYSIILNGSGEPVCITETKVVYIMPYNLISPEHAWHEGEGDRSYHGWRSAHDKFFEKEYKEFGKNFYEQAPMVCEVFEKVW